MLNEQMQNSNFIVFNFGERGDDVVGNEVGTPRFGRKGESFLCEGHDGGFGEAAGSEKGICSRKVVFEWNGPDGVEDGWTKGDGEYHEKKYLEE